MTPTERTALLLAMLALPACREAVAPGALGGDPQAGKEAIAQYACQSCHTIPGITGANRTVGPPLGGVARRKYVAGVLLNTPENLLRWIRDPLEVDPLTAMPDMGVSERHGRDIVAYLYTLD